MKGHTVQTTNNSGSVNFQGIILVQISHGRGEAYKQGKITRRGERAYFRDNTGLRNSMDWNIFPSSK